MYYLMARYYDATLGRFITSDWPHGLEHTQEGLRDEFITKSPQEPLAQNQYLYVRNNPIMFIDPSEHRWTWIKSTSEFLKKVGDGTTHWLIKTYMKEL